MDSRILDPLRLSQFMLGAEIACQHKHPWPMEKGSVSIQYGHQACPESREKAMSPDANVFCAEAALSPRIKLATNHRAQKHSAKHRSRYPTPTPSPQVSP